MGDPGDQLTSANTAAGLGIPDIDHYNMVIDMVREISRQDDPQAMIAVYRKSTRRLYGGDSSLSLSRRGLAQPTYRITRSSRWERTVNPWTQVDQLPLLSGGLLAELLYGDEPRILRDFQASPDDPAFEYLKDARSLACLPLFDQGVGVNAVVRMSKQADGFDNLKLADAMLTANLFGRATNTLVVARQLDHEMERVAEIQRSLLPERLPDIPTLDMAVTYQTAAHAGGDYYDFFELPEGRWGVLIADVSGHGTPAAVVMAMLRTMLRANCYTCATPAEMLCFANQHLCDHSDRFDGTFVTAFYGIYDPADRTVRYSCAGHNPPLLIDPERNVREIDQAQALPLGVDQECAFVEATVQLQPGDTVLLYTDGITDAANPSGDRYGRDRLLNSVCGHTSSAERIVECVTANVRAFSAERPQEDDQTLLALRVL